MKVVLFLIVLAEGVEGLDYFRLCNHLISKLFHVELVFLLEELHRLVQKVCLVSFRHLEFFRKLPCDEALGHGQHILGLEILVLPLSYMEEIVDPVPCLGLVGVVDYRHDQTVSSIYVIDDASLVQTVDVYTLSAYDFKVSILLVDIEICVSIFSFE